MIDFSNRVALVTGAGRGLGYAYCQALAARGATVIVQDRGTDKDGKGCDPAVAETAAATLAAAGGKAFAAPGDISTRAQCASLVGDVMLRHGRLDVLIHNAGWVGYQAIEALDPEFLDRMIHLGIHAPLWLAQAAWPAMRAQRFGRILLTTSDRAIYPEYAQAGLSAYAASKMAAIGITNALSLEGREHGILVNAISPVAKTRMWGIADDPQDLRPDAVAPGGLFLVSPESTETGWVLRAANGQFVATQAREAANVDYPRDLATVSAATPEVVRDAWSQITVAHAEHRPPPTGAVSVALNSQATLGESPVWSERRRRLLWVDTEGRTLNQFDPQTGRNQALGLPDVAGMVAERSDGTLIVALGCYLATVSDDGAIRRIASAPDAHDGFRLNDGRFDAAGRLWIGLMDGNLTPGTGVLYRYDPDGSWHAMDRGFTLLNGLDWSPDAKTFYVTDSRAPTIYAYPYDVETGALGDRRTFATFGPDDGFPDGLLVNNDGSVLSTLFAGSAIQRIEPDGRFTRLLPLPVSRPTSCTFGPDGSGLYVTTARLGLDDDARRREPAAGALLRISDGLGR